MRDYTDQRSDDTPDALWFVQHPPVYTLGMHARPEHVLMPGAIPVLQTDRGGQVTYHGPGQWVVYPLLDLRRLGFGIRSLVSALEQAVIDLLHGYGVEAHARREAPGVYVGTAKIAALGLASGAAAAITASRSTSIWILRRSPASTPADTRIWR